MSSSNEIKFNQKQKSNIEFQNENQIDSDNLQTVRKCENCGWAVTTTADICENCGDWLLKGKCNFCYADIEEGQKFCTECGNPPEGIICKKCGKLSHFDFCPQCNIALTEQASETVQLILESEEFQNIIKINENETIDVNEKTKQADIELEKLKKYLEKFPHEKPLKKNTFTLNNDSSNNVEDNLKALEQSRQNVSNEEKKTALQHEKEKKALKFIEDTRNKTFSNNQEARKFFGALKILIPQVIQKKVPVGWRCNAYDCTHPGGTHECADPSSGGVWIYETRTENSFKQVEI